MSKTILNVIWTPDVETLARCVEQPVEGSVQMDETAFLAECDARRIQGWLPATPKRTAPLKDAVTARLEKVEADLATVKAAEAVKG